MVHANQRFEQVDKRFGELRADFNQRSEQLMTFLWNLVGIFTTLVVAIIGLPGGIGASRSAGRARIPWKLWRAWA